MKHTKIVATISDQRCEVDFIRSLYEAGMNVVRLNTAHMSEEGLQRVVSNTRMVSGRIGILIDTKGPEIRTTTLAAPMARRHTSASASPTPTSSKTFRPIATS